MKRAVLTLLLSTALAGCSMEPKYARPEAPVPPGWPAGDAYLKADEAALPSVTWQDIFKDPRLQKLREAIAVLGKNGADRAEKVQTIFSDKTPPPR